MNIEGRPSIHPLEQVDSISNLDPAQKRYARRCIQWGVMKIEEIKDKSVFNPKFRNFVTAIHETGHAILAKTKSWGVNFISTVRKGDILGYTSISPDPTKSDVELHQDNIAISRGGEAAENLLGYRSYGSGSDHSHAHASAFRLHIVNGGTASPGSYESKGASDAYQTLASRGLNSIEEDAFNLHVNQELAPAG